MKCLILSMLLLSSSAFASVFEYQAPLSGKIKTALIHRNVDCGWESGWISVDNELNGGLLGETLAVYQVCNDRPMVKLNGQSLLASLGQAPIEDVTYQTTSNLWQDRREVNYDRAPLVVGQTYAVFSNTRFYRSNFVFKVLYVDNHVVVIEYVIHEFFNLKTNQESKVTDLNSKNLR